MRSRRAVQLFFGSLLLVAGPLFALDPARSISQYGVRNWTAEDGLPQNSVNAITQTADGYLWLATQEGVARFDGVRFQPMIDQRRIPVHRNPSDAFLIVRNGTLWIGGSNGLIEYRDGIVSTYGKSAGLPDENVWSLAEDTEGSIWIGSYAGGITRLRRGRFTTYTTSDGLPSNSVWSLSTARDGALWIGTSGGGISRMRDGKFTNFTTRDGLTHDVVWNVYEDRQGNVWIGTGRGLCRYRNGKIERVAMIDDLDRVPVRSIYEDREGVLWIGTEGRGLVRYAGGRFSRPAAGTSLSTAGVISMFEDREGSLWVGTTASGLYQLRSSKFTTVGVPEGLVSDEVWTFAEGRDGAMWVGTNNGISRIANGTVSTILAPDGTSSSMVRSMRAASDGTIWIGTYAGAVSLRDGKFTRYHTADGLSHEIARSVGIDHRGTVWIGTRGGGLNELRNGAWKVYRTTDGLANDVVLHIAEDRDGSLWIATYGGVSRFDGVRFTNYTARDGLSSEKIRVIHHDGDAHWFGTYGGGLNRLKNGRIVSIRERDGLFDDVVFAILDDTRGNFWMMSNRGIFCVSKRELNDFADGKIRAVHSTAYDSADGMRKSESNSGSPGAFRGSDGRLYFATVAGVAIIDPAHISRNTLRPPVWIEEVLIDGRPAALSGHHLVIAPGSHRLEIHYTALCFVTPKKVAFRYRLKGFSDEWVDAQNRRVAFYTNVPPGEYRFEVMGSNDDGVWNAAGNPLLLTVRAAFYQTAWFWIAVAVAAAAAIRVTFTMRVRMLQQREHLLAERVREQTAQLSVAKHAAEQAAEINSILSRRKRLILNSAAEGIFGLDERGIATFINPSAARMLGWTVDDLLGRELHRVIHAGSDAQCARSECSVCSDSVAPQTRIGQSAEFRRGEHGTFPVEYTTSAIVGESGHRQGVVVTFRDVTHQRAVEKMKDEFVSTVSHELRTPLTSIRGALGMLTSGLVGIDENKARRMLDIAVNNTDRLVRLINDILDQERIESGRLQLVRRPTAANDLLLQAVEGVQTVADQSGIDLMAEPVDATLFVDGDRIVQTLTNLLGNAIKFSERGTRITAGGMLENDRFVFRIADQGRGIPADKLEMIFERFKQVDASDARQKGGTGLGLSICRSIVRAHGGEIWAENGETGSVFCFTIPASAALAPAVSS
jgi:PAS domain S-box-containing protein